MITINLNRSSNSFSLNFHLSSYSFCSIFSPKFYLRSISCTVYLSPSLPPIPSPLSLFPATFLPSSHLCACHPSLSITPPSLPVCVCLFVCRLLFPPLHPPFTVYACLYERLSFFYFSFLSHVASPLFLYYILSFKFFSFFT